MPLRAVPGATRAAAPLRRPVNAYPAVDEGGRHHVPRAHHPFPPTFHPLPLAAPASPTLPRVALTMEDWRKWKETKTPGAEDAEKKAKVSARHTPLRHAPAALRGVF